MEVSWRLEERMISWSMLVALLMASEVWSWNLSWLSVITPKSFSCRTWLTWVPHSRYCVLLLFLPRWRDLHLLLKGICHLVDHLSNFTRSSCSILQSSGVLTCLYIFVSSANNLHVYVTMLGRSFIMYWVCYEERQSQDWALWNPTQDRGPIWHRSTKCN